MQLHEHVNSIEVNGQRFQLPKGDDTGREVRRAAGLRSPSDWILIKVTKKGSTSVGLDEKIEFNVDGITKFRAFESGEIFTFTFDENGWEWGEDNIAEAELRNLAEMDGDYDIVLNGTHDSVIERGSIISFKHKGAERLESREVRHVQIIVNGRPHIVDHGEVSFEAIVKLAYPDGGFGPDITYTVGYRKGREPKVEGSLIAGGTIKTRKGMVFNVTCTNRS